MYTLSGGVPMFFFFYPFFFKEKRAKGRHSTRSTSVICHRQFKVDYETPTKNDREFTSYLKTPNQSGAVSRFWYLNNCKHEQFTFGSLYQPSYHGWTGFFFHKRKGEFTKDETPRNRLANLISRALENKVN